MDAGFLNVLHHAGDEHVRAVAQAINIHFHRIRKIAVEQQRILAEQRIDLARLVVGVTRLDVGGDEAGQGAEQILIESALGSDDHHRAPAQHIGWAHNERQAKFPNNDA